MNKEERERLRNRLSNKSLKLGETTLYGLIVLNLNITKTNYFGSVLFTFILGFFVNGVELTQQNLLVNELYYNYSSAQAIQYNSFITLQDLLIKIIVTPFFGIYVDRYGRQKMMLIGYFLIISSLVLFPLYSFYSAFHSLGWLFAVRFIYSNGSAIIPIIPLVADYVDNTAKGRAIGISCLAMSLGVTVSTLMVTLLSSYNLLYTYMGMAGTVFVLGAICLLCVKSGNFYYKTPRATCDVETGHQLMASVVGEQSKNKRLSMVRKDIKSKPWILVSYIFALLNGTAVAISSQLLNLYVQSFNLPDSAKLGTDVVFKANIASTLTSLILGPTLDLVKPIYIGILAFAAGLYSYVNINSVTDPRDTMMLIIAIGIGITYACSQLLTKYLGFKSYRTSIRGILFSIANIQIMFGVIIVSVIGGNLFKYLDRNWPFYIAGGVTVVCFAIFIYLYCGILEHERTQREIRAEITAPLSKQENVFYVMEGENVEDVDKDMDEEEQGYYQDNIPVGSLEKDTPGELE